jgi:hypothetical protein
VHWSTARRISSLYLTGNDSGSAISIRMRDTSLFPTFHSGVSDTDSPEVSSCRSCKKRSA